MPVARGQRISQEQRKPRTVSSCLLLLLPRAVTSFGRAPLLRRVGARLTGYDASLVCRTNRPYSTLIASVVKSTSLGAAKVREMTLRLLGAASADRRRRADDPASGRGIRPGSPGRL